MGCAAGGRAAKPQAVNAVSFWLSILVPVYNVQPWLQECLASVVEQSRPGVQILVLDDCSTDASWSLLQSLSQRWPGQLQLLRHAANAGLSAARNTLMQAACGEYLWFLDADDKLLPNAIERLHTIVQIHSPSMVLCDFAVWRMRQKLKHRLRGESHRSSFDGPARTLMHERCTLLAGLLSAGQLHAWSKISRRTLWGDDLHFPVGCCFEDMATMPLLALRADSFWYEPQPWVAYRQRPGSILSGMTAAKALNQSGALATLARALPASSCHADQRVAQAMSCQCARNLIGAMRWLPHAPAGERAAFAQQLRNDFMTTSPLSAKQWVQLCLKRGWWLRAGKFLHAWGAPLEKL